MTSILPTFSFRLSFLFSRYISRKEVWSIKRLMSSKNLSYPKGWYERERVCYKRYCLHSECTLCSRYWKCELSCWAVTVLAGFTPKLYKMESYLLTNWSCVQEMRWGERKKAEGKSARARIRVRLWSLFCEWERQGSRDLNERWRKKESIHVDWDILLTKETQKRERFAHFHLLANGLWLNSSGPKRDVCSHLSTLSSHQRSASRAAVTPLLASAFGAAVMKLLWWW